MRKKEKNQIKQWIMELRLSMEDKEMSVVEHLEELRKRIILALIPLFIVSIIVYQKIPYVIKFIKHTMGSEKFDLVYFSVAEGFMTRFKLAIIVAIIILSPLIIYELLAFIKPALTVKEKKVVYLIILIITVFFIAGIAFAYVFILPNLINFLFNYSSSYLKPIVSGSRYFSFIAMFSTVIGVVFLMPPLMILLNKLEVLSYKAMKKFRKYLIIGLIVIQLTFIPVTDIITFLVIVLPIPILYEICICIAFIREKKKIKSS